MRTFRISIIFAFFLLLSSCVNEHISLYSIEERLTSHTWVVKSYVNSETDYTDNSNFFTYQFNKDGSFILTSNITGLSNITTWKFIDNKKYIQIGNDTYSLDYISNKLLTLGYGTVSIYLVPEE